MVLGKDRAKQLALLQLMRAVAKPCQQCSYAQVEEHSSFTYDATDYRASCQLVACEKANWSKRFNGPIFTDEEEVERAVKAITVKLQPPLTPAEVAQVRMNENPPPPEPVRESKDVPQVEGAGAW